VLHAEALQQQAAAAATIAELEGLRQQHYKMKHCLVCRETPRR
jgi:hypothetical protein